MVQPPKRYKIQKKWSSKCPVCGGYMSPENSFCCLKCWDEQRGLNDDR